MSRVDTILKFCKDNYKCKEVCRDTCKNHIENECLEEFNCLACLNRNYNFNVNPPIKRKFCKNRCYKYLLNKLCLYASEIDKIMSILKKQCNRIEIASIGCGPSTELYAIDNYVNMHQEMFPEGLKYIGFDLDVDWNEITTKNQEIFEPSIIDVSYQLGKDGDFFGYYSNGNYPDVIILNFMLSDMAYYGHNAIKIFLDNLCIFFNNANKNILLIMNDIALINYSKDYNELKKAHDCYLGYRKHS